jgi:hypothetical protein
VIDIKRLQLVKRQGGKVIARCPACWEKGSDRNGDHLIVYPDGRFACCCHPGPRGEEHRQRIYALACATTLPPEATRKPLDPPLSAYKPPIPPPLPPTCQKSYQ